MGFVWKRCLEAAQSIEIWGTALDRKWYNIWESQAWYGAQMPQDLNGKEPHYEWECILFFSDLSSVLGCVRVTVIISFPATSCQKLIKANNECKLEISMRCSELARVAVNSLGGKWECRIVQRVVDLTNKGQGSLTCRTVYLLLSKGYSCYRPRRISKRKWKYVWGTLWMPSWVFSI